jgi:hypothetical protein
MLGIAGPAPLRPGVRPRRRMARIAPFSISRIALAVIVAIVIGIVAGTQAWHGYPGNDVAVIREVESLIAKFGEQHSPPTRPFTAADFSEDVLAGTPTWQTIEDACYRLSYENAHIAKARAMSYLQRNPVPYSSSIWDDRAQLAKQDFRVAKTSERVLRSIGFGGLGAVAGLPASWIALLLVSWLWYFALDRVKEVSGAIRGRQSNDGT